MVIEKPAQNWTFDYGDYVQKSRGANWRGRVVGFYSSLFTREGYAVESSYEPGSVQVYPAAQLEKWDKK